MTTGLTETEVRVLRNLHLTGGTGKMGSLNLAKRRLLITGLVKKGLLSEDCVVTKKGIEVSAPFYNEVRA